MQGIQEANLYRMTSRASRLILTHLVPSLPEGEQRALVNQLSRASQALPQLVTEGYARYHEHDQFQKYCQEAMTETYEIVVSLCCCHYWYATYIDRTLCRHLIDTYSQVSRQLLRLAEAQTGGGEHGKSCC